MKNLLYQDVIRQIRKISGKPQHDAFLKGYLGNDHPRYVITTPALRTIAKEWMQEHKDLPADEMASLYSALIEGPTSTEKIFAGILMGYSTPAQRKFDPLIFDRWLDHLVGWAEIDAVCTGNFPATQLPTDWPKWKKLVTRLSRNSNINKRRASLVLFCSPVSRVRDERLAETVFMIIDRLKSEKDVLITKAISWVLRSMIKHYREEVTAYLQDNVNSLPKIAIRETMMKLKTGKKTTRRAGEE